MTDARSGEILHVVEAADLLTPVGAYMRLSRWAEGMTGSRAYTLLLESVEGGATRGRYSVIALMPELVWQCQDGQAALDRHHGTPQSGFVAEACGPMDSLRRLHEESRIDLPAGMPPMIAGLFGYLGYDMVRCIERLPDAPQDDAGLPDGVLIRPRLFAVFDSVRDELVLAVPLRQGGEAEREAASALIEGAKAALNAGLPDVEEGGEIVPMSDPISNFMPGAFEKAVLRAQDYIAAGDAFQIVPSQRFEAAFSLPPLALYRALRRINPAPFLFLIELDGFSLVGSSPEILVRLRDGVVTVRPLAGTRPRGGTTAEDQQLEAELLADEKERAEHLMLIDLGRNDVGRVATLGSVDVTERFVVERYSHVMHISSTVEGRLRPGADAVDALAAAFPAGTLSGAPKIRAMQIIDELEPTRRGPYAGCIGYFAANGEMDTCIGLRMAVLRDGRMFVQAGCGVVAESVPALEEAETRHKARALFRAAEAAVATAMGR